MTRCPESTILTGLFQRGARMFGSALLAAWRRGCWPSLLAIASSVTLLACATPPPVVAPGSRTCAGEFCIDNTGLVGADALDCGTALDPSNYPLHSTSASSRARRCALSAQERGVPF